MSSDLNEIVDMLESKLAEKEKEIEELKRMNEIELSQMKDELKAELKSELRDEIVEELANKLKEEILSLKRDADMGKVLEQRIATLEAKVIELTKAVESLTKEVLYLKSDKLPIKPSQSREKIKQQLKSSKTAKLVEEKDDDIIVCD